MYSYKRYVLEFTTVKAKEEETEEDIWFLICYLSVKFTSFSQASMVTKPQHITKVQ